MTPGERLARARMLNGFNTRRKLYRHLANKKKEITYSRLGALERDQLDPNNREINILCDELSMSADWWLRNYEYPVEALSRKVELLDFNQRKQVFLFLDALSLNKGNT